MRRAVINGTPAGRGVKRLAIVVGTRPEIIKMAPVVFECQERKIPFAIIHSGQHYTRSMDSVFFEQIGLPKPARRLRVGSDSRERQVMRAAVALEGAFAREDPPAVLVQGDTNTVLAGALAAQKLGLRLGHVEAGLRSGDARMPEEFNRIMADRVSDLLFAPTAHAASNLRRERVRGRILVTGNTVVDSVVRNVGRAGPAPAGRYFLASLHRQESVDERSTLAGIAAALGDLQRIHGVPVVLPLHPRSRKMARRFGIGMGGLRVMEPAGYLEFLGLERGAALILTDSGGVQEEACVLGVPCVTMRESTERPETVEAGANIVAGTSRRGITEAAGRALKLGRWKSPLGDGRASGRILDALDL